VLNKIFAANTLHFPSSPKSHIRRRYCDRASTVASRFVNRRDLDHHELYYFFVGVLSLSDLLFFCNVS
jgi:hypothetical protein